MAAAGGSNHESQAAKLAALKSPDFYTASPSWGAELALQGYLPLALLLLFPVAGTAKPTPAVGALSLG